MPKFIILSERLLYEENIHILREIGRQIGVKSPSSMRKGKLIREILAVQNGDIEPVDNSRGAPSKPVDVSQFYYKGHDLLDTDVDCVYVEDPNVGVIKFADKDLPEGCLQILPQGFGFLRYDGYKISYSDLYVSEELIKTYGLKSGDMIKCTFKKVPLHSNEVDKIVSINGTEIDKWSSRQDFSKLVACHPDKKISLSFDKNDVVGRVIDMFAPIGKGQRGLIVAPPKTGKTTMLKNIAKSIENNYPDTKLIVLLIDERPEEVTEFEKFIKSEVVSSTFDEEPSTHIRASEYVLSKAKRQVEMGKDVVILMDSITKLTRAYNNSKNSSGKTLSGGIDPTAFYGPKKFFGSARNIENGGSLTIIATALIETGSRMDEVVFEEFKGTGNMEIVLSRSLAEKKIYPAIDFLKSGTRRDDLLLTDKEMLAQNKVKEIIFEGDLSAVSSFYETLKKTENNDDFINKLDTFIDVYKRG